MAKLSAAGSVISLCIISYKSLKQLLLLLLSGIYLVGCQKEPEYNCLPDIVGEVNFQVPITIVSGMPFEVPVTIQAFSCGNITTDFFDSELIVEVDSLGNSQFQEIQSIKFESRFDRGDTITEEINLVIIKPGKYRFRLCVDINNIIEERDETNNCNQ